LEGLETVLNFEGVCIDPSPLGFIAENIIELNIGRQFIIETVFKFPGRVITPQPNSDFS
jgi:hypothetical protein